MVTDYAADFCGYGKISNWVDSFYYVHYVVHVQLRKGEAQ